MYSPERWSICNSSSDDDDDDDDLTRLRFLVEHRRPPTANGQRSKEEQEEEAMSAGYHTEEDDLKAFERRLEELAAADRPRTVRWPVVLGTIFACTAISACHWLENVRESDSLVLRSLSSRGALALSLATIVVMILYGVKQVIKPCPSPAVENTRDALAMFRLNCDNDGRLARMPPIPRNAAPRASLRNAR